MRPSTKTGDDDVSRPETEKDAHSRQLDIIVYDFARFPVFEQFEEFAIVPPEGVVAVISVKKTLAKSQVRAELEALAETVDLCRGNGRRSPFTALVSFGLGSGLSKDAALACFKIIEEFHAGDSFDRMITELCLISDFTIFKFRAQNSGRVGHAKFVRVEAKDMPHISLQRLIQSIMSVYYDASRGVGSSRPGFVSFEKGTFENAPKLGLLKIGTII